MNKRQVIILWIVTLVLGAAVVAVKLTQKGDASAATTARAPGQTLFESFPATEVAAIEVAGADGSATIHKKDGKWTVGEREDYPAAVSTVHEFLRLLTELKVTRAMEAGPSVAPRFGMDESAKIAADRGLTATFKDAAGKEVAKVSLGKNIENAASSSPMGGAMAVGRYIRNHADESGFYAVGEMFPTVTADPVRWLNMDFFSPEKIQSISLSQPDKEDIAWKVVRESEEAEFKLDGATGDEVLDSTAGTAFKSLFSYIRFEDVVPAGKVAERTAETGKRHAVIQTFEGFTYKLTLAPAKSEKPADPAVASAAGATDQQLLTVSVSAELPKERKKEEGEKPEDAKTKDEAFATRLKSLTEKLEKEKSLEGRTFLVSKSNLDALLKERAALVKKAGEAVGEGADASGVQQLPGGLIAPPPPSQGKGMVATTPPIEIPAGKPDDKDKSETKDEEKPKE